MDKEELRQFKANLLERTPLPPPLYCTKCGTKMSLTTRVKALRYNPNTGVPQLILEASYVCPRTSLLSPFHSRFGKYFNTESPESGWQKFARPKK